MKKNFKPLSLLVILGLVACSGSSISRAEAIKILDAIQAKQEGEELQLPDILRFEMNEEIKDTFGDESVTYKNNIVIAANYTTMEAYYKWYLLDEGYVEDQESWIYFDEEKFYFLEDDTEEKTYYTKDAGIDAEKQFANFISEVAGTVIESLVIYGPEMVKDLYEDLDDPNSSMILKNESYKTKGAGNLTIDISHTAVVDDDILSGKDELQWIFDEYALTSYRRRGDVTTSEGTNVTKIDIKMNYKKSGISLPKLSDFDLVEFE